MCCWTPRPGPAWLPIIPRPSPCPGSSRAEVALTSHRGSQGASLVALQLWSQGENCREEGRVLRVVFASCSGREAAVRAGIRHRKSAWDARCFPPAPARLLQLLEPSNYRKLFKPILHLNSRWQHPPVHESLPVFAEGFSWFSWFSSAEETPGSACSLCVS